MNQARWHDLLDAFPFFSQHVVAKWHLFISTYIFSLVNAYWAPFLALGLVETQAREFDLSAFLSLHKFLLWLMSTTWPGGCRPSRTASRTSCCKVVSNANLLSAVRKYFMGKCSILLLASKLDRWVAIHNAQDCPSQLCWALVFSPLGLCLSFSFDPLSSFLL